jgi:hypothetical protein
MATAKATKWRSRIVGHAEVDPAKLIANPLNWRKHPASQNRAIEGALDALGWVQQIIVNKTTGNMIDGHARVALAVKRGESVVPVVYVALSKDEERATLASLDPMAALAVTDSAALFAVTDDLSTGNPLFDSFLRDQHEGADATMPRGVSGKGPPRSTNDPAAVVKCVIPALNLHIVEQALDRTGQMNRGEALLIICRSFLDANNATRQLNGSKESGAKVIAAKKPEKQKPGGDGVSRRVRQTVRSRVRGNPPGRRVRDGLGKVDVPGGAAPDVAGVRDVEPTGP